MTARIGTVTGVRRHGETLTIVTVQDGPDVREVVANLQEDGSPRWKEDEMVVYVSEGSIVPDDVLRERGYWDEAGKGGKGKGMLGGNKGNRVKMREIAGFESRGLLFKTRPGSFMGESMMFVDRKQRPDPVTGEPSAHAHAVRVGDDISQFLGITEHAA